jgi:polar amino acid transport system substrate-binding protein
VLVAATSLTGACSLGAPPTATPETAKACAARVALKNPPKLTMSTDDPVLPPWFGGDPGYQFPMEPAGGSGWQVGEPYSMEGFEGGISYSLADALGYEYDVVEWAHAYEPADAVSPGPKDFDVYIGHVAVSDERAAAVDLSDPYYTSYQAVAAIAPNPITGATLVSDLKPYLLGSVAGSSSSDLIEQVVQPDRAPAMYPDMPAAVEALTAGDIDGLVADINFALYLRDGWIYDREHKVPNAAVVGRFAPSTWTDRHAVVLEKDSELTPCVNAAVAQVIAENFITEYSSEYIDTEHGVPDFR